MSFPPTAAFYAAVSASPVALDELAQRLPPARRRLLRRFEVGASLLADLLVAPVNASGTADRGPGSRWLAGRLESRAVDDIEGRPSQWDGEFIAVTPHVDALLVERDPLGACPLYATRMALRGSEVWLAACSAGELRALRGGTIRVDRDALLRFLGTGAVAGRSATLFDGIEALERGRAWRLQARDGSLRVDQVDAAPASATVGARPSSRGHAERVEALRDWLSTTARHNADELLALPVSGGIDSSGLLAAVARVRGPGVRAYTYSQRDPGPEADEARWARLATQATDARHEVVHLEAVEIPALMRDAATAQDFPFASPVVVAQRALFKRAADDGVQVLLGGHGPDLLCGGADSHLSFRLACLLRDGRLREAARFFQGARRHVTGSAARLALSALRQAATGRSAVEPRVLVDPWLAPDGHAGREGARAGREWLSMADTGNALQALIDRQLTRSLGVSSLLYERANAAAAGIEVRQPYLRASLRELMLSCEADELVSPQGQPKAILREALRGWVPAEILARERRIGFAVPAVRWLLENRAWVDRGLDELRAVRAWRGPAPATFWQQLRQPGAPAWRAASRAWRWLSLLEWSRGHDAGLD